MNRLVANRISHSMAVVSVVVAAFLLVPSGSLNAQSVSFEQDVSPILADHCYGCHGPETQKSDLRLDTLSYDLLHDSAAAETWHDILGALNRGEMPPKDQPQPTDEQRRKLVDLLTTAIKRVLRANTTSGGSPVLRRLNRVEYQNTMRDLLGIDTDFAKNLPPDAVSEDGFRNNGRALRMSALQLEYYLQAARQGLRKAIVTGPAPPVFHHVLREGTENGGRTVQSFGRSNILGRTSIFLARIAEDYPEQGEFLVRVRARAELREGQGYPRMEVALGFRADTQLPHSVAGVMDVPSQQSRTYEVRGRIEDFPLPSRSQSKFPGLLIKLANLYDDGSPLPDQLTVDVPVKGKKKLKKKKVWPDEAHMPKLHIESVEFVGPVFESWPPKHHTDILFASPKRSNDEPAYVAEVLHRFMRRAYRRPVTSDEIQPFFHRQVYLPDEHGHFTHENAEAPRQRWTQLQALDAQSGDLVWLSECGVNMGCVPLVQSLSDGSTVLVVGRGGGHSPPEAPEGVSMIRADNGKTLWTLELPAYMSTQTYPVADGHALIFHKGDHLWVDAGTGKITRKVSIVSDIPTCRWSGSGHEIVQESLAQNKPRSITQQSNLLVG